ncbi:MAG: cyclic nucleotide-binding domain-containing protein [Gemmatimonadota bacterium]|jgi:ATP/ADP translocase
MMSLYFVVLVSVGILRPVKNALALDGRAEGDFYQVYLVSALAVLFAPVFNHLADRVPWRRLIPATAAFFALNLVLFRVAYSDGSTTFGLIFYGWYDLFAAALVTQFFMAVQMFFNARDAKAAIPLVIAAGSMGVVFGGVITGAFSRTVGTPNLLLVAAGFVGLFAVALPLLWQGREAKAVPRGRVDSPTGSGFARDLRAISANRHIRLIAGLVLLTVLVKQIVDYEFNEASRVFAGQDVDAISSFQGYVFAVKDILPVLVLLPLGPLLRRFGVGFAVLLLPVFMLGSSAALAVAFSVWTATVAKVGDSMFRYSAERTAREILYVPVPTELKLKAKAYIDAGVEKGFAKAASGVLIGVCAAVMDYRSVTWVAVAIAAGWCVMALAAKREYVAVLAESIRGRFANLDAGFASLTERSTLAMVEDVLRSDDPVQVGFGLDLVEQAGSVDARHLADELELLLGHPDDSVRVRVLGLLARFPGLVREDEIRPLLQDRSGEVREAAVGALVALRANEGEAGEVAVESTVGDLLESADGSVRRAALSWLLSERAGSGTAERLSDRHMRDLMPETAVADPADALDGLGLETRVELALAGGLIGADALGSRILGRLLDDLEPTVRAAAIRSAARVGSVELGETLVEMLADPDARGLVKDELANAGTPMLALCRRRLADPAENKVVRRGLARVLARVPEQDSVNALLSVAASRETPFPVAYASIKALNKLRASAHPLDFDRGQVQTELERMVDEADRYQSLGAALATDGTAAGSGRDLLSAAAREAWVDRREVVFRLLGLVFPPDEVYRCHGTLEGADDRTKANALEWLERTLGRALFVRVEPVLDARPSPPAGGWAGNGGPVERLAKDPDPWISSLAKQVQRVQRDGSDREEGSDMDLIAKALLLQKVDLLEGARTEHLGLLAGIAEEIETDPDEVLVRTGEPNDALYVVMRGSAELSGVGDQTLTVGEGTAFGTWALIDSAPSVVGARMLEHTRLLRITRGDFEELLSDHPELATGMLQALARRLRALVA